MPEWKTSPRRISSLVKRGIKVYRDEGLRSLVKKTVNYISINKLKKRLELLPLVYRVHLYLSIRRLRRLQDSESSIRDVLHTTHEYRGLGFYRSIEPMQHEMEIITLLENLKAMAPKTIIEIGTARGGTLYLWSRALDTTESIVSIDINNHPKREIFLKRFDLFTEITCINGHSQNRRVTKEVDQRLGTSKADVLYIDGGHRYEEVKADFESYIECVSENGIIVLHDIVPRDDRPHYGVDKFWQEIKQQYETEEIIDDGETGGLGIVYL